MTRRTFSDLHPACYRLAASRKVFQRQVANAWGRRTHRLATTRHDTTLAQLVYRHNSLIRRRLGNTQPELQDGKAASLAVAAPLIDGVVIAPGQTFSLWELVGRPTPDRGFGVGLVIRHGRAEAGQGGGLCQLGNLIHWMVLHADLTIVEHHHHSGLDLFPDHNRQIPFGTGTSVAWNYLDYRFRNDTDATFQLRVRVDGEHLRGELRADRPQPMKYHVRAEDEYFYRAATGEVRRHNTVWRLTRDKRTGDVVERRLLLENDALVCYDEALVTGPIREVGSAPTRGAA